jgi:hypothetical protein
MKKNLEKTLVEMFGDPIDPKFGVKVGETPGITSVGAVGVRDLRDEGDDFGKVCPDCGMMMIDGQCGCNKDMHSGVCDKCKMMEPEIELSKPSCGCGMVESHSMCDDCGKSPCECGMNEADKACSECGMDESVCECGMNEVDVKEVTPKGYEKIVKGLKKSGDVENPWAIAWWMKGKGIKPKKK